MTHNSVLNEFRDFTVKSKVMMNFMFVTTIDSENLTRILLKFNNGSAIIVDKIGSTFNQK